MVINLPRDDVGVLRLKEANAAKAAASVSSLAAAGGIGAQAYSPPPARPAGTPRERRRGDRRQGQERRDQDRRAAVLLDTRSHHERRTQERRQHTDTGQRSSPRGVDVRI
jgi:hypothetical protein